MQLTTRFGWLCLALGCAVLPVRSAVLPDDRADMMYHYYDGGGTKVTGPALLVRKDFAEQVSMYASAYTDTISGASIDVVTTASPYKEKRDERGLGIDYLHRNTLMGLSYTNSSERDYTANTVSASVAHEVFDGLTTLSLGYVVGHDQVGKTGTAFQEDVNRYQYKLGVAQVFTKSFLMNLEYEGVLEEGYLNSPYRAARLQGLLVPERYPGTRDSHAVALRAVKGFESSTEPGQLVSSLHLGYRYFSDTWTIKAHTAEVSYERRLNTRWLIEPRYRYYRQTAASFYADNFMTEMTYMARDKELSAFNSHSLGAKAAYSLFEQRLGLDRATLNFSYDYAKFSYDNFTDTRSGKAYEFDANIFQVFLSAWY